MDRRQFSFGIAATIAAAQSPASATAQPPGNPQTPVQASASASEPVRSAPPISVFTKPFNSLSYDEMAAKLADIGFDGIEAPVRRGGNVDPNRVAEDLPRLVRSLADHGLRCLMITTEIHDADDDVGTRVLQTAADLGIGQFRMGYVKYDRTSPIPAQIDGWKRQFTKFAGLCERLGMTALYQNHAGPAYMGAAVWDLDQVLADVSPDHIGVAFDIRHATVEAGSSWPIAWRMIRPRVRSVYVKDFRWVDDAIVNVPLGDGLVKQSFVRELGKSDFAGTISLHEEYLDHRDPGLVPEHLRAMAADLQTLRRWLGRS